MSAIPHTPGPWFTADHDDFVVAAGNGFSICDCAPGNPYDVTDAQGLANARLIAAAPELLDALKKAVENIKVWHNMGGNESVWDIYWRNAPEMKPLREALTKVGVCHICGAVGTVREVIQHDNTRIQRCEFCGCEARP